MEQHTSRLKRIKQQILETIFKYIPGDNCAVFLFGSLAEKEVYPSSDIDIGIICDRPLAGSILVKIKEELQEVKTLRDIDVIDFSSVRDGNFLKIALREVRIWHQTLKSKTYLNNLKKRIAD